MDERFQDRIDDYLLNRMDEADKAAFLREVEQEKEKKEQLEFTREVKDAIRSRQEKLNALKGFQQRYETERKASAACFMPSCDAMCGSIPPPESGERTPESGEKPARSGRKIWLWISCAVAVLVVGFFAVRPMFEHEASPGYDSAPVENVRGGDDVFNPATADSTENDTIRDDAEKEIVPDE